MLPIKFLKTVDPIVYDEILERCSICVSIESHQFEGTNTELAVRDSSEADFPG